MVGMVSMGKWYARNAALLTHWRSMLHRVHLHVPVQAVMPMNTGVISTHSNCLPHGVDLHGCYTICIPSQHILPGHIP